MKLIKNFILVVLNLVGELWTGFFNRNPEFYDKHTNTKTKLGYIVFVVLSFVVTIGIATLLYSRINH
ncbi:hypothetical protein [Paenibacillus sp. SN-8-1]|uniref:hypothetical protein n=1 Tax=Paenibacillus sp. SN-8-1 TaxID=3435409 RepID=UPI003D9A7A39